MIDHATKERIMDAARIEEVIGEFVTLKRSGANYVGLCPFHPDKHPSMSVSATKQFFKCFSCGHSGNVISFLMDHEHISYPEALRYLARKYGIEIVEKDETPEEAAQRMRNDSLLIVNDVAQKFYQDVLWDPERSHMIGLGYFRQRGFTDETIRRFGLGYAPAGYDTFTRFALDNGYKEEYLLETGLSIKHDDGRLSDRFYERVMFPIYSLGGKVIAFGGRIMSSEKKVAKYVNSPESSIYSKSRSTLYGLFQAKNAIARQDKCIMVEGYADVISMHQRGIENVVASSGTALTEGHINLVKRFTKRITFIYDSDPAGIKASMRGIDMVLEAGMEVKIVLLPQGEDPDSFAQANEKADIEQYIASHEQDFITFKINILSKDIAENDIYGRTQMISEIVQTVSVIPDEITRNVYIETIAGVFNLQRDSLFLRIRRMRQKRREQTQARNNYNRSRENAPGPASAAEAGYIPDEQGRYPESEVYEATPRKRDSGIITNDYLAVCERELVEMLIKWGEYTIHWESNMTYGEEKIPEVTVSEYIRGQLDEDGLTLQNPLYKKVYDAYYALEKVPSDNCEETQGHVIKYFTFHDDMEVMKFTTELLSESYPITIKNFNASLTSEEHRLYKDVPKAVLQYKSRIVGLQQTELQKEIAAAGKAGDDARQKELMHSFLTLANVRNQLEKALKKY
ncbi:MAG: DNA primase [Bacteroidales bacterium]|nr:DNA primase [Bacteroidales bacterium]